MEVFNYIITTPQPTAQTPAADPCESLKLAMVITSQKLSASEERASRFEDANKVLGGYIVFLVIAFVTPGIMRIIDKVVERSESVFLHIFYLHVVLAQVLEDAQLYIQAATAIAAVSSMMNAFGVKDGSWILPTDPITTGHKLYTDWKSGQNITLVRSNTSNNVVQSLETANVVFAVYMIALFLAFTIKWVSEVIRLMARFNLQVSYFVNEFIRCGVTVINEIIAYIQAIVLFFAVNSIIYNWSVEASPVYAYLDAAMTVYKVANEGASSFCYSTVQNIVAHLWSNSVEGGLN